MKAESHPRGCNFTLPEHYSFPVLFHSQRSTCAHTPIWSQPPRGAQGTAEAFTQSLPEQILAVCRAQHLPPCTDPEARNGTYRLLLLIESKRAGKACDYFNISMIAKHIRGSRMASRTKNANCIHRRCYRAPFIHPTSNLQPVPQLELPYR